MKAIQCAALAWLLAGLMGCSVEPNTEEMIPASSNSAESTRPNILIILADDMGFADAGYMGSEIATPNLDALAAEGVVLTDFHTATVCNTTRVQLLTGVDHNRSAAGAREQWRLAENVETFATLMQDVGYHTYLSGKWDAGRTPENFPDQHGFDESFMLAIGAASHYSDNTRVMAVDPDPGIYVENGERIDELPDDFYSTTYYTDKIIEYIDKNLEDDNPFIAYLAVTAPHWPLMAPRELIEKYQGVYDAGYDETRTARFSRLQELGFMATDAELPPMSNIFPQWQELSEQQQRLEARRMEIYAAMVDKLDQEIGRLLDYLESIGERDNTLIVFTSDNGAEGGSPYSFPGNIELISSAPYNLRYDNMGNRYSFEATGPGWAQVQAMSGSFYKYFPTNGGTQYPAIVNFPNVVEGGRRINEMLTIRDLTATILDIAGVAPQVTTFDGREILPVEGDSFLPLLTGEVDQLRGDNFYSASYYGGFGGLYKGDWRIRRFDPPYGTGEWQLFNRATDPFEQIDLASSETEKLAELLVDWDEYRALQGLSDELRFDMYALPPNLHYQVNELIPEYGQ